jgi:hypothetical protein
LSGVKAKPFARATQEVCVRFVLSLARHLKALKGGEIQKTEETLEPQCIVYRVELPPPRF